MTRKIAPPAGLFSARILPACASVIVRAIDSPSPSPFGLVVKKESNSRFLTPASMPWPPSITAISTFPLFTRDSCSVTLRAAKRIRHRIHCIDHEVDQQLLQLNTVAIDTQRLRCGLYVDSDLTAGRLDAHQTQRIQRNFVQIERLPFDVVLLQERTKAAHDFARSQIIAADVGENVAQLIDRMSV